MASKRVKRPLKGACEPAAGDTVTIPTARFLELLAAEAKVTGRTRRAAHYPRSPIDLNPDLVAFIVARLGRMRLSQIRAEAVQVFGDRAPTKSAFDRFMRRYEAGKVAIPPVSPASAPRAAAPPAAPVGTPANDRPPRQFRQIPDNPDK